MQIRSYLGRCTAAWVLLLVLAVTATAFGQLKDINVADVVVATGSGGTFQVWRNTAAPTSPPNYQFLGTFSDASGTSTACANDVNWRVYGTLTTSSTAGLLDRFAVAPPHAKTIFTTTNDAPKSVAIDGNGFIYVGGNQITQYVDSGGTLQQLTMAPGPAPYLDLKDNSTLYYTNGGPTIFQLGIPFGSPATPLIDTSTSNHPATFTSLRVLPPGTPSAPQTKAGSIIVANGSSIFRYDPPFSLTNTPAATYTVGGNPTFTSVAVDTNRHSVWGGTSSGAFYRFDILTGTLETPKGNKALSTGTGTLNGMCVEGAFSAAQPQWTLQSATATPSANTVEFNIPPSGTTINGPNIFKATLVGLTSNDPVNFYSIHFSQSNNLFQGNGITDPAPSLQCAKDDASTSPPSLCEAYKLELAAPCNITTGSPCSYVNMQVVLPNYTPATGVNARFYGDMSSDDTEFFALYTTLAGIDPTTLGGGRSTVFSVQESTIANSAVACGTPFQSPINGGTNLSTGTPTFNGNLSFSLQVAATPTDCQNSNFINNLTLRLKQVLASTTAAPQKYGIALTPSPSSNGFVTPSGCFAGAPSGVPPTQLCDAIFSQPTGNNNAYNVGVSTQNLPKGTYIYTVSDETPASRGGPKLPQLSVFITQK